MHMFALKTADRTIVFQMLPPAAKPSRAVDAVPAKLLHSSLNKIKHPVNVVTWTPEGRRLLTGSSSGEFTLWNGMGFNFETILQVRIFCARCQMPIADQDQAHDAAIRAATYSHNEDWLVSADQDGIVKYWQTNFNNVKAIQAHSDPIRDLAFSPNDSKFVTACDDHSLKIFDFGGGIEESALTGHGWDVKSVDWHPFKGLIVSGSKDHQVKLWDPRTGRCLTTLHGHKNTIAKTKFEPIRGQLLATCARDQTARVFDLRMMRDICLLRGHEKDISTLTWHPIHVSLLTTGGADGSIFHYLLDEPNTPEGTATSVPPYDSGDPANAPAQTIYPAHKIPHAHDFAVWSLGWHPIGHILASGSNDRVTRFWTRARPGETHCFNDKYHLGEEGAVAMGTWDKRGGRKMMREDEEQELEDEAGGLEDQQMPAKQPVLPGLPGLTSTPSYGLPNGQSAPLRQPAPGPVFPGIKDPAFGNLPQPPSMAANMPNMNMNQFNPSLFNTNLPPPPPPPQQQYNGQFYGGPPPLPANIDLSKLHPGLLQSGFQPPPLLPAQSGLPQAPLPPPPPPAGGGALGGLPGIGAESFNAGVIGAAGAGVRRRGPLPSQKDSLKEEQRRGNYRTIR